MIEEYESYTIIQKHMHISELLYKIDLYGKHILSEIMIKKNIKTNRRSYAYTPEFEALFNSINDTINVRRFKSRLYLSLQYYLDEALFHSINEEAEFFFIEDDKYELTQLYFGQEQWIRDPMIQCYHLLENKDMNIEEAMLLRCYFNEYSSILTSIEDLIRENDDTIRFKRKLFSVINKIRKKHDISIKIIDEIITSDFNDIDNVHKN